MAKDIFGDDYFSKHRDNSAWESLKGRSISKVLNLKNKPKPKLDDILPVKNSGSKSAPEEILDDDFREHVKITSKWKKDFFKTLISGVAGGLIFYLATFITVSEVLFSKNFWVDTATIVLVALIVVIILGVIYKVADDRM